MNLKKCLMAAAASLVVMFVLSFLWHKVLMSSIYMPDAGIMTTTWFKAEPDIPLIILAYTILAILMSYIYPKGIEGDNKLMNGLRFGAVIGLLWVLPYQVVLHAVTNITSLKTTAMDAVWHMAEQGIGGIIIAYIYEMKD